jgi:hypothetical protein
MRNQPKKLNVEYKIFTDDFVTLTLACKPDESTREFQFSWGVTNHCLKRLAQRGFSYQHLLMAMEHGQMIFKQGLTFYVVTRRSLPDELDQKLCKKLDNMVVVVARDGSIMTCYKSKNGIKHIHRKSNHLYGIKSFTKTEQTSNKLAA